jgi:hypothetical protein
VRGMDDLSNGTYRDTEYFRENHSQKLISVSFVKTVDGKDQAG